MSYPGNASLPREVQERIQESFRQSLDLITAGNDREALLGCEFILGMDPLYQPAAVLLERLQSDQRPIPIRDLIPRTGSDGEASIEADAGLEDLTPDLDPLTIETSLDSIGDLGDFDLEGLEDIDDLERLGLDTSPAVPPPPSASPSPAPAAATTATQPATGLGALLQDLLDKRNFAQVVQIAESQRSAIESDPALQSLVQTAETQLESSRYAESFLDQAVRARDEGRPDDARKLIAKARVLDPRHPKIRALEASLQGTAEDAAAAGLVARQTTEVRREAAAQPAARGPFDTGPLPALSDEPEDAVALDLDDARPAVEPMPATMPAEASAEPEGDEAGEGDRVQELLDEGQRAFDGGDYQGAIDVWSRIFLLDIDNDEASRRIDEARGRRAELERQAEEVFHEGLDHVEGRRLEEAKRAFARVLELQPGHSVAREYLDQLEAGEVPVTARPEADAGGRIASELDFEEEERDRSLEAAVRRDRVVVVKKADKRLVGLGAVVLVVLLGALGFLVIKWNDLFPNADDFDSAAPVVASQIARATALYERGNVETAIRILEKVPGNDPQHTQAQALLAQWRASIEAPPEETGPTGPSPTELARRARLVGEARSAADRGRNLVSLAMLERAAQIVPLDEEETLLQRRAMRAVDGLREQLEMVDQGQWENALPGLWRRYDAEPGDLDARQLIVECYYNLALRSLQRGDAADGAEKLREALALEPDNATLQRLSSFAKAYRGRSQDMLYRIFVKYLPARP